MRVLLLLQPLTVSFLVPITPCFLYFLLSDGEKILSV